MCIRDSYNLDVIYGPAKPGEVFRIYLDNSKAISALELSPNVSIEEGIKRTVEWFRG